MIDAHVHLWTLGANDCVWPTVADGVLHRDFAISELIDTLENARVDQAVLIQSQESARDTEWLLRLAGATSRIAGVVGWADLRDPAAIASLAAEPLLKGLRPMVQGYAADWYDEPTRDAGVAAMAEAGLVLDALVRPAHLPALARLATRHPGLVIVIDHAAKPASDAEGLADWKAAIAPLALHPNVHVKLSGLLTELPRQCVAPVVQDLLALFGPERLLWGSDWPVLTAAGSYAGWLALTSALIPAGDHAAVFGGNAARLYRIAEAGHA